MYPVLLARHTHVVSVAEDEVLFFLKRDRRSLGGAWRGNRKRHLTVHEHGLVRTAPGWAVVTHLVPLAQGWAGGSEQDRSPFPGVAGSCVPGKARPSPRALPVSQAKDDASFLFLPRERNDLNE